VVPIVRSLERIVFPITVRDPETTALFPYVEQKTLPKKDADNRTVMKKIKIFIFIKNFFSMSKLFGF